MSRICSFRESDASIHIESSTEPWCVHALLSADLHSTTLSLISLFNSTHSGAHLFLERILYKVSSAGSAWGLVLRSNGFPFPGKFSNCPSSMECHIRCSTTLIMSVSDLINIPCKIRNQVHTELHSFTEKPRVALRQLVQNLAPLTIRGEIL